MQPSDLHIAQVEAVEEPRSSWFLLQPKTIMMIMPENEHGNNLFEPKYLVNVCAFVCCKTATRHYDLKINILKRVHPKVEQTIYDRCSCSLTAFMYAS